MLAQNFMTASDLAISEAQRDALAKTLVLLETDKLKYAKAHGNTHRRDIRQFTGHFNMEYIASDEKCGTVCCICGTAQLISGVKFGDFHKNRHLYTLFYPDVDAAWSATPSQAAVALRSYLTTGNPRWDLALAP